MLFMLGLTLGTMLGLTLGALLRPRKINDHNP